MTPRPHAWKKVTCKRGANAAETWNGAVKGGFVGRELLEPHQGTSDWPSKKKKNRVIHQGKMEVSLGGGGGGTRENSIGHL